LQSGKTEVRLSAEIGPEGLDLEISAAGSLIYMRQVPAPADLEQMSERIKETLRAYVREQVGPPVERMVLSGTLGTLPAFPLERLEAALEMPVQRVEPGDGGPLRESVRAVLQAVQPELTFSDLLGAALSPRLLELDLLPIENRLERARQALSRSIQQTTLFLLVGLIAGLVWVGVRVGTTAWMLQRTQAEVEVLKPEVGRVQAKLGSIRAVAQSRAEYAFLMECMGAGLDPIPGGVALSFLGVEPDRTLTVRGWAPELGVLTRFASSLRENSIWEEVLLRSAKVEETADGVGRVDFELFLRPVRGDKR
jgi:hypothetical protein